MVTLCWAAKGGSGTTVVATALALSSPRPSLLVDLDGEIPAVLGLPEPDRPGVAEWLLSDTSADHLAELLVDIAPRTWLLPWQSATSDRLHHSVAHLDVRWALLGDWLHDWSSQWGCDVTVDVGTRVPSEPLATRADRSLLVTRPCYLSLRRAVRSTVRPTGVILVDEPGRGLAQRDVEHALGVPIEAVVSLDPTVSRAVDAGLLASRLPRVMTRALRRAAA
ncbi:MAG: hypothetical protein ACM3MM_00360 [Acidobacteriota bacterium]